jgi:hypothetical protein
MSRFTKFRELFLRLMLVIGFIVFPLITSHEPVFAQNNLASGWIVRSFPTVEYGLNDPKGLTFSSAANAFLVLNGTRGITLITMGEDYAGSRNLPEVVDNPSNMAFDSQTGSLLVLQRGNSELIQMKADDKGLPDASTAPTHFAINAFGIKDPQGVAFDPGTSRLFILDTGTSQIISVTPHPTRGFDADAVINANKVERISLKKFGTGILRGVAHNPGNDHLYVSEPRQRKLYELTQSGDLVSTFDLASLGINNPASMTFAPSADNTDDPGIYDLFLLDLGQTGQTVNTGFHFTSSVSTQETTPSSSQIVELSLAAPAALPAGTMLLSSTLVRTIDLSTWINPSPDPSGIDYWPATDQFLISDSEVEEAVNNNPPVYWHGYNVFLSTLAGDLTGNCTTFTSAPVGLTYNNFANEPTGVAINPNNNHIFFSNDGSNSRVFEVGLGPDGTYCTTDDTVTRTLVASLYGATDAEDVAYGNNTIFIADGINAEVYRIPLGANGILGGGDDGPVTHFDTATLGFSDLEGIGYNADSGTLLIVSSHGTDNYLGETTTSGILVNAYDLSFMGTMGNLRSDVTYAPSRQNPAIKNIYIVSRGIDNNDDRFENDGKAWEIDISGSSPTPTFTSTPTNTSIPTITPTSGPSVNPFYSSFDGSGSVGGVPFADEDILQFNGTAWSLFFDGSDVGLNSADIFGFYVEDADTILLAFNTSLTASGKMFAPTDIAQFDATSLGTTTAGTFSMYLNGADVGLDASTDYLDALEVLPDGKVLLSTRGNPSVPGLSGLADEDILAFTPSTLGPATSGTWSLYFDGSDVGLADSANENVDALDVSPDGSIYLSTVGAFSVSGVVGEDEDVFVCTPTSLGSTTACNYSSALYFDGSTWGLSSADMDGFSLPLVGSFPTATPSNTPDPTHTPTITSTPSNTSAPTETPTPTDSPTVGPSPTPTSTPTLTSTTTATSTPTATNMPGSSDLIFADGFESDTLSAWTSNMNDLGDLRVSATAALVGSQGLQALIDDTTAIYVNDDSPNAETRYRARFYFDPNSITMTSGDAHFIFKGFMNTATDILQVEFRNSLGAYQIRAKLLNDSSAFVVTNWFTISDASHVIELDWRAATAAGANNGGLTLWVDGLQQVDLTGIDNDTWRVDRARLGALAGMDVGTSGTYYFDAFESRRQTFVGP